MASLTRTKSLAAAVLLMASAVAQFGLASPSSAHADVAATAQAVPIPEAATAKGVPIPEVSPGQPTFRRLMPQDKPLSVPSDPPGGFTPTCTACATTFESSP